MRKPIIAAAVSLALSAPAVGAPAVPGFEQALGSLRAQVLAARAAQVKAKSAQDITQADSDARSAASRASMLEMTLSDLRRRAADARRSRPPAADPFFRSQLQSALFDLRQWAQDLSWLERRTAALASSTQKDPDAASAAQQLIFDAQNLRSEADRIVSDVSWMTWDLQALGLWYESGELDRLSREGADQARQIGFDADAILNRAR